MKLNLSALFVFLLLSSALFGQKEVLFDGKNLQKWAAFEPASGRHDNAEDLFHFKDKVLHLCGKKAGWLMTRESYTNFVFTAEFRWNEDSEHYERKSSSRNSGVMYLIPESAKDTLFPKGIQFQIKEKRTGDFIFLGGITATINGKQTIPGRSVTCNRMLDAEKKIGEWNKMKIIVKDGKITQILNGKIVNQAENPSELAGRIVLLYEGYPIDFRKVVVKKM